MYERNDTIVCKWRSSYGNWTTRIIQAEAISPSLSIAGDLIHFIWEKYFSGSARREIQTCYTTGFGWSRPQTIALVRGEKCYPYIEKGSVAVWADLYNNQWEIYASQRNESGAWTTPQNISQTSADSKYPQVAMYQTITQTRFVYVWTEGNSSPYEVKILPVSLFRSNPIPLYAFDLGEEEPSVFTEQRTDYIVYGPGYEKSADYDTNALSYTVTGLEPDRIYHLGLVFYQDETNKNWKQSIEINNSDIKTVVLPRNRIVLEKLTLAPRDYQDGVVRLRIKEFNVPKAVLSAFAVWEFCKENRIVSSVNEYNPSSEKDFSIFMLPNPARGKAVIHYQTPLEEEIAIKVFSVTGQLKRVINERKPRGFWSTIWDGKDSDGNIVANGVYFVRFETRNRTATRKIVILR